MLVCGVCGARSDVSCTTDIDFILLVLSPMRLRKSQMVATKLYPRDRHEKTSQLKWTAISNSSLQLNLAGSGKRSPSYTSNWEVVPGKHAFL